MKTIIKGIDNEIITTPIPLKVLSFSLEAAINTPIIEMKKTMPEMKNIQPNRSAMIKSPQLNNLFDFYRL